MPIYNHVRGGRKMDGRLKVLFDKVVDVEEKPISVSIVETCYCLKILVSISL